MKIRNTALFSRALRAVLCAMLAFAFLLPALPAGAAEKESPSASGKLRAIQTYELLDMLAEEHGKVILVNFFASFFCIPTSLNAIFNLFSINSTSNSFIIL